MRLESNCKTLALALAGLVLATLPAGCFSSRENPATVPPDELRILMRGFNEDFSTQIQRVSDLAVASTDDPAKQRVAIVWKMRLIPLCRSFLEHPDAKVTFVDTWALCAQVQQLVEDSTDTANGFSDADHVARDSVNQLMERIERIGQTFLTPEQIEETREPILAFAESREVGERFFAYHRTHDTNEKLGSFMTGLVTRPLSAINPFGGVSDTAIAIHEISESADSFRDVIQELPDVLRWQTQLTLHDLRHSDEVTDLLQNLDEVAENTTRYGDVAENLPDELRTTLDQATGTIDRLEPLVVSATGLMESFNAAGATWVTTFQSLQEMVASLIPEKDPNAPPPDPDNPPRPFDILDYATTAEQLTATAAELRELLDDVRSVAGGTELQNVADSASDTARSTVDHVALRVGQILLGLLVGLGLLRVLWARTGPARITPGPTPTSDSRQQGGFAGFKRTP